MRSCGLLARAGCLERRQRAALLAEPEWGSLMPDGTEAHWPGQDPRRPPAERRGQTAFNFQLETKRLWGPGGRLRSPPGEFLCHLRRDGQRREVSTVLLRATPAVSGQSACLEPRLSQPRESTRPGVLAPDGQCQS